MILHVAGSEINIDIEHLTLPENFTDYLKKIFGNQLEIKVETR